MKFSFIIPTLNEEKNIERVIGQFKKLDGKFSYEVIVADGNSKDRTVEIAKKLGTKVCIDRVKDKTIASGRNLGAKIAKGDILVFCDADTMFHDVVGLLSEVEQVFYDESVVAAVPRLEVFPSQKIWKDRIFLYFYNTLIKFSFESPFPFSGGQCQIIRKSSFNEVKGYNGKRVHAEDSDLLQKLVKIGRLKFLPDFAVLELPRRYRKVGHLNLSAQSIISVMIWKMFKKNFFREWKRVD